MPETDFCSIDDQADLSEMSELSFQPARAIGSYHSRTRIAGLSRNLLNRRGAEQLGRTGNLGGNPAQMDRTALMDSNDQPDEIAYLCHSLVRTQFTNPLKPGMIEGVDRHEVAPFVKWLGQTDFTGVLVPISFHFVKVSGG
jgi:hypothetical protein